MTENAPPVVPPRSTAAGVRRPGMLCTVLAMLPLLLFPVILALWAGSYVRAVRISWGDRHRGTYRFVNSAWGGLFLETRTNCDISHHFTWYRTTAYSYGPQRPVVRREFPGFGWYTGTQYCWYQHLWPVTTLPSFSDPRWQKEPYRMLRISYAVPAILIGVPAIPLARRTRRRWRIYRRAANGLCIQCAYNLTGNTSGVCPECGTRI
jgi:hypothetical protein